MLKFVYTLFLGLLVVAFVGLGIDAFYQNPVSPEYPTKLDRPYQVEVEGKELTEAEIKEQQELLEKYDQEQKEYMEKDQLYNRNVSIIAIIIAVIVLAVSLLSATKVDIISDGLILGGVFTLMYGIGRGFAAEDSMYRFSVVSVGLVIAFALGYLKFIKPQQEKQTTEKAE